MPMKLDIDTSKIVISSKNIQQKKMILYVIAFGIIFITTLMYLRNEQTSSVLVLVFFMIIALIYVSFLTIKDFSNTTIIDKIEKKIHLKQRNKIKTFITGDFIKITIQKVCLPRGRTFFMGILVGTNGRFSLDINEPFKDDLIRTCKSISNDLGLPIEIESKEFGLSELIRFKNR